MERLFERHDVYLSNVPMGYIRDFMQMRLLMLHLQELSCIHLRELMMTLQKKVVSLNIYIKPKLTHWEVIPVGHTRTRRCQYEQTLYLLT